MSHTPHSTSEQSQSIPDHITTTNSTTTQHGFQDPSEPQHQDGIAATPAVLAPSELEDHLDPRYVRVPRRAQARKTQAALSNATVARPSPSKRGDSDTDDEEDTPFPWISILPAEALSRVLSHLDPTSLARAAAVSRLWSRIAKDDVTWRDALSNAFDINQNGSGASIALRRTNKVSWKAEYIHRSDLIKRWKRSRAPAISSDMRVSNIHAIAFSESHSFMLSASISYGIASRSDPFKGKVARGFVDANGLLNGAGIGNPNVEFSPHVTAIGLAKDTSRIAWGFRDGTLAMTLLTRQGSNPRGMIRNIRFSTRGSHVGPITAIAFDLNQRGQMRKQHRQIAMADAAECFITGGQDGRVRLWTHNRPVPLWFASTQSERDASVDAPGARAESLSAITQLDLDADRGVIVAGTAAGDVHVWSGIKVAALLGISSSAWDSASAEIQTPAQVQARKSLALEHARVRHTVIKAADDPVRRAQFENGLQGNDGASVDHIFLDAESEHEVMVVTHRASDTHLAVHRLSLPMELREEVVVMTHVLQTESPLDTITCLRVDCAPTAVFGHSASGTPQHSAAPSPALRPVALPDGGGLSSPGLVLGPAPGSVRNLSGGVFAERKFVCVGTSNGNLFGWPIPTQDTTTTTTAIGPHFKLDCHHTALTCVDFTPHLFAVGTSDGTVKTFNSLTGELVRTWNERTATRHAARMLNEGSLTAEEADRFRVRQVIVGEESIVAAVGPFLLAWRPGSATSGRRNKGNGPGGIGASTPASSSGTPSKSTAAGRSAMPPLSKYAQMREIKTELAESSAALAKEKEERQASYERIKHSRATVDIGGLDEDEALEYAMMLSREDEEARQMSVAHRNDEAETQLSELARIRKEEAELQEALEQIALAEGDDSVYSSAVPSSRASDAAVSPSDDEFNGEDDDDDEDAGVGDDEGGWNYTQRRPSLSPGPSPNLTGYGSPSRAWTIMNNAGSSTSATQATAKSRWGNNSKVRMVSVPRSSRLSLSPCAAGTPPQHDAASMLSSPEHWPAMSSSLSSSNGGRSPCGEGSFSLGPSRAATTPDAVKGKQRQATQSHSQSPSASPSPLPGMGSTDAAAPMPKQAWTGAASPVPKGAWAKGSPQVVTTASCSGGVTMATPSRTPDMDDDLRFAIELSLAEERSRAGR